ncbi:MAG: hypothetical protein ACEQSU_04740 [Microgenomates group bacterium]
MQPGVGTNRYSYSFGDPVNGIDPSGHAWWNKILTKAAIHEAKGAAKLATQKATNMATQKLGKVA